MKDANRFTTKDLHLSAFLVVSFLKVIEIVPDNLSGESWFIFEDCDKCNALEKNYWSQIAQVEPIAYINAIKTLKQRILRYNASPSIRGGLRKRTTTGQRRSKLGINL
ncbi:MAG: DUF5659 domain-containing protein [candidate division WWE3 bacterium]|nr:DUF5659 domain-containing protein [candidate division WWE3 bacterium]